MVVQTPAPSTFLRPEKTTRDSHASKAKDLSSKHRPAAFLALHSQHLILFGGGLISSSLCIKEVSISMTAYKFPMRIARTEELSPEALVDLLLPA